MTDQEIRIAVAELCGIKVQGVEDGIPYCHRPYDHKRGGLQPASQPIPNYPEDLNACHQFELAMTDVEYRAFHYHIVSGRNGSCLPICRCLSATARQRCEAFLRVKGLWKEQPHETNPTP